MPQDIPYNNLAPPGVEEVERYPYGRPRFPNLDPRAYFNAQSVQNYGEEPLLNKLGEIAPWALMGLARAPVARTQPMTPQTIRREVKQAGDDSAGQHIYEAVLGRTRAPGEAVAKAGSGWWHIGGQPIPKPTNILAWLLAGAGGYGGYKVGEKIFGDPFEHWNALGKMRTPGTPEYEAEQKRLAELGYWIATREHKRNARRPEMEALYGPESMKYGLPHGWEGMKQFGKLAGRERTLPSQNAIPFPPDPNKP